MMSVRMSVIMPATPSIIVVITPVRGSSVVILSLPTVIGWVIVIICSIINTWTIPIIIIIAIIIDWIWTDVDACPNHG